MLGVSRDKEACGGRGARGGVGRRSGGRSVADSFSWRGGACNRTKRSERAGQRRQARPPDGAPEQVCVRRQCCKAISMLLTVRLRGCIAGQ
eukprot:g78316.t1